MKTEWDFSTLFDPKDEQKTFEEREKWRKLAEEFKEKWKNNHEYLKDVDVLKEALIEYEKFHKIYSYNNSEYLYYALMSSKETGNFKFKAKLANVEEFSVGIQNMLLFFELSISKIDKEEQSKFLNSPELSEFSYFLEKIFLDSKYLLSEKEEKIMTLKANGACYLWKDMREALLSEEEREIILENGEKNIVSFSEIMGFISNKNEEVRKSAAEAFNDILKSRSDVAEFELNAILLNKKINDDIRGYSRPDESRHIKDNIESEIVDSLIKSVSSRFNLSREYYQLKANLLGKKQLEYYERNVSLFELKEKYSFEKTVELLRKVFSNLDIKFLNIFNEFLERGQIDVYPKKGKRSGAFCNYSLKIHPVYVLLNHQDELRDVTTFAHEMGHAINDEMMRGQNSLYFATSTGTAEVASTFMEDFVFQELLKSCSDKEKLGLLMEKLNDDISSIMRQVAGYSFEKELHEKFREKNYLSKEEIGEIFQKHMVAYMGDAVKQDINSRNWWVYWSHIREYFYNYSYASGLLISKTLQRKVKENPSYIEKVKEFMSIGTSKSFKDTFLSIDLDVSNENFWELGLKEIEDNLEEAKELAEKIEKSI